MNFYKTITRILYAFIIVGIVISVGSFAVLSHYDITSEPVKAEVVAVNQASGKITVKYDDFIDIVISHNISKVLKVGDSIKMIHYIYKDESKRITREELELP